MIPKYDIQPTRKAYVQFGKAGEPMQTVSCELAITPQPKTPRTASGYSQKAPTEYVLKLEGKWRRIYSFCISNTATLFIGKSLREGQIVNIDF